VTIDRSEQEVALRALCLTAVATAGAYASVMLAEPESASEAIEAAADLGEWLDEDGLADGLSLHERELLERPLGDWSEAERFAAASRGESLGVLLWALSLADELPSWDEPFDAVDLAPVGDSLEELLERARLRDRDEIERARDLADLWQWRATVAGRDTDVVGGTARAAYEAGEIPAPIAGDFPAFGKAYRELAPYEAELAASIAAERRQALAWLCGQGADWDLGVAGE
jgi:hypothetical protein